MNFSWPRQSILELFQETEEKGISQVELNSNYEAILFRYALHNFRRRNKNPDLQERFKSFQINIDGSKLTISKPNPVEIRKTGT